MQKRRKFCRRSPFSICPSQGRAISHVLRPFLPNLDSIRAEGRLEQLANDHPSLVRRERGHYVLNEQARQAVLASA
jgi:hypothetical protein